MGVRTTGMFSGLDPKLVDALIEAEKIPIEQAKARRENTAAEKEAVSQLQTMLSELDTAVNGLKTKTDFYKMKVESSHPDIIEGVVDNFAMIGTYEFEVRGLAKNEKELAYGFPDKDDTPVGFGFLLVEREDLDPLEVTIEPGSTLQDVATQINEADAGVRAMVINTKYEPDSYRLLVISEESGKESRIILDEDTTFLEFKEQVTGRNLDVLFEDVPVTDTDNILEELVDGVTFQIKRSEPGTRVQMSVVHDVDATVEGIKNFVDKYNEIARFSAQQSVDPRSGDPGQLAGDGSVRQIMRQLQGSLFVPQGTDSFRTLAEVGITTNPKTGELQLDETKVRSALADDYDGVAKLFIRTRDGSGVGERLAQSLRNFRDPETGVVRSRIRGLERVIENQDKEIQRRERQLEDKEVAIRRRFAALEERVSGMKAQGSFLAARFGGGGAPPSQGGGG